MIHIRNQEIEYIILICHSVIKTNVSLKMNQQGELEHGRSLAGVGIGCNARVALFSTLSRLGVSVDSNIINLF